MFQPTHCSRRRNESLENCGVGSVGTSIPTRATRRVVGQRLKSHIPKAHRQVLFNIFLQ